MRPEEIDEALRALSHADRRMFLSACWTKRRAAGDLATLSRAAMPTVSEHLKVLRKAGLVTLEREGRFWFYRTDRERLSGVVAALGRIGG